MWYKRFHYAIFKQIFGFISIVCFISPHRFNCRLCIHCRRKSANCLSSRFFPNKRTCVYICTHLHIRTMLQVCCSVLQSIAVCCSVCMYNCTDDTYTQMCCTMLQCVAACCTLLQRACVYICTDDKNIQITRSFLILPKIVTSIIPLPHHIILTIFYISMPSSQPPIFLHSSIYHIYHLYICMFIYVHSYISPHRRPQPHHPSSSSFSSSSS